MRKYFQKPYLILATLIAVFLTCFAFYANVSADDVKVKDGEKLCGTFTFDVSNAPDVQKQDFQVCAIVDGNKNFKSSLDLRPLNWNNSIAYVSRNENILNIYDSPMNQGAIIGSLGVVYIGDQKQFIPKVGESFVTYLQSIKSYLKSLPDRKYWRKVSGTSSVSHNATFKNQIDWSKEEVTADDATQLANNKAKCEAQGHTWQGNSAQGFQCVDADGNVADASLSIAGSATGGSTGSGGNACYSNAGALGWVLCPVIDTATGAINSIYHELEENYLKIDVGNIFNDSSGVELAWATFRDIANIVFIILFVIVILSQLTGFGIDNYGIKKILPKLIVVAILLNLSYIICQLAVDASNILGVGLRGFLEGLIPANQIAGTNPDGAQWTVNLAGGAIMIGAAIGLTGGIGMLAAILGAVITAVVAVFFLWIILVIRSAGIVILITIAPLAIACYLLPNTEKLGKRWLDIFKALLVLYPLCSLVVGAGALAGHILSYSSSEIMQLAAMIVQVVPFFLIPMLLRNSLNAMGNIGARINGLSQAQGRNLSGRARQGLNNTNFAQLRREDATRRRMGILNRLPSSQRVRARRSGVIQALDEREKKDLRTNWRDANGNFDLAAVQAAYDRADAQGDTIARQAALEAWSETDANGLSDAIMHGRISAQGIDYVRSNGTILGAVSRENGAVAGYLRDLNHGADHGGVAAGTTYADWSHSDNDQGVNRELAAVQNMSASAWAAQDHGVARAQVEAGMLSAVQQQQLADNPNLVSNLQGDVRQALQGLNGGTGLPQSTQTQHHTQSQAVAEAQSQTLTELNDTMRELNRRLGHQQVGAAGNNPTPPHTPTPPVPNP